MELLLVFLVLFLFSPRHLASAQPGFLSLACGANQSFTDEVGLEWQPDAPFLSTGAQSTAPQSLTNETIPRRLRTLRSFPGSGTKFCYTLQVNASERYLVRATFLYGNYDGRNTAPEFPIYLNVTRWSDVQVTKTHKSVFEEIVFLSTGPQVDVCVVKGSTGTPFISTLELRRLFGSMYSVNYQLEAHLKHVVRINFGATTVDDVRYPDDEVDRIWQSDLIKPNNLAHEAPGTIRVNTSTKVGIGAVPERPPEKVLQTAVVGTNGSLTYRFLIQEFPANVFARSYFAEIQTLKANDVRAFTFILPNDSHYRGQVVNLARDVGAFQAYAPGYDNLTLNSIINFGFQRTADANVGPILNAMEILEIVPKQAPTSSGDVDAVTTFARQFHLTGTGDPCLPSAWNWLACSQDSPPRITGLLLSNSNLSGPIPAALSSLTSLNEIQLGNNSLTGQIPDLSRLSNLKILHVEDNMLSGPFPDFLAGLGNLEELHVENNMLTGSIPPSLLKRSGLNFQYFGNPNLCISGCSSERSKHNLALVLPITICGVVALLGTLGILYYCRKRRIPDYKKPGKSTEESIVNLRAPTSDSILATQLPTADDGPQRFSYSDLKIASNNFTIVAGSGGFGIVYYGRLKNGKEVAIKVKSPDSHQGTKEFVNEVTLLSKIHHRNLVAFLGYCDEDDKRILVYEFMHLGTLRDCLYVSSKKEPLDWATRLKIAVDAARGLEYLHTGCTPSIIHRDVKSSNILINNMKVGKVADFGLSKAQAEQTTLGSTTTVRGTVGYLDPEYYLTQRLTEKSDVYSFGIVLLELISAREPLHAELFRPESNIVLWARTALQKGSIELIIDPRLKEDYVVESVWKTAELAMACVEPFAANRPAMSEVMAELQEATELQGCVIDEDDGAGGRSYHLDYAPRTSTSPVFAEPRASY